MKKILETFKNKWAEYLLEMFVIVMGILGAFALNNWNEVRKDKIMEIELLRGFQTQLESDQIELDESLAFYREAKNSTSIILYHLENDLPYNDSLKLHFFTSTRFWGDLDFDKNVFETLKSIGIDLISNQDIRKRIVKIYEDDDVWITVNESIYLDFLFNASENLFNTRFEDVWNGDYKDLTVTGEMVPLNFDKLKSDQEYLYFMRSQEHRIGWLLEKSIETTKTRVSELLEALAKEIEQLENK